MGTYLFGGVIKSIGSCMSVVLFLPHNIGVLIKHDSYFKVKGNGTPGQKLSRLSAERSQRSIVKTL